MNSIQKRLEYLHYNNQFRYIPNIESKSDGKIVIDGMEYINFASNDYLGISTKLKLRKEFIETNESLLSSASARLLSGSSTEYSQLEKIIAGIFQKEKALIFNTGYQANLGVISALINKGDVVFSDKLNHASIIDGMRLSNGEFFRYKHLDYNNLEALLEQRRNKYNRALIISESLFSMDGDLADIEKLVELKKKYNCLLMVDGAHAFCVYGDTLSGISNCKDIDIITGTLGKALGSFGAFCVSNNLIIDYLINEARPFIFSTAIPPLNIAWSVYLLANKKDFIEAQKSKLNCLVNEAHEILDAYSLQTSSKSHIIPILIGDNENTLKISERLKTEGYYIPAIRPPTVPTGTSRLRLSLTADITIDDFKRVLGIVNS